MAVSVLLRLEMIHIIRRELPIDRLANNVYENH